ncbi:hypothetical protein MTYP_00405 [Methylophilaceae bacterium]|nr:hypothetical protein MTYP_00405 [Methylophilaceae bacterium]
MLITQDFIGFRKHALVAMCVLFGLSDAGIAGPRDSLDNSQAPEESITQSADDAAVDAIQQRLDGVSAEERMRLRMDLNHYSRTADPAHVQIEDRRRVMHRRIQERFFSVDKDNDGQLSREETAENLPQVARHFNQVDLNGDGYISITELVAFQAQLIERQRAAEARLQEAREAELREIRKVEEAELASKQAVPPKSKSKQAEANRKSAL